MGTRKTKIPAIPEPTPNNLMQCVAAMKEVIEVAERRRGDPLDAKVTYRDLVDAKLARVTGFGAGSGISGTPLNPTIPGDDSGFLKPPTEDGLVLPGRPQNVRTMAVWDGINVMWDWPDAEGTNTYWKRAVVWASGTSSFANAQVIGYTTTNFFTHMNLGLNASRWYWVAWEGNYDEVAQAVTRSDPTPYHWEPGIKGTTAVDPTYVLGILAGQIRETQIYQTLNERINLVDHNPAGGRFTTPVQTRILLAVDQGMDGVYAAIEQVARTSTSFTPGAYEAKGEYALRIDLDGYITGFGLSAFSYMDTNTGKRTNSSAFVIRAQNFAIATPLELNVPGFPQYGFKNPKEEFPFIVGRVDGVSTVGINGDLVVDGTITARHIQANSIGAAQIKAQEIYTDLLGADRIVAGSLSTSVNPNFRLEINGYGSSKELYPLWYGNGNTGGSGSVFYGDKLGNMALAGNLSVTGTGRFFCGNVGASVYRLELAGANDNFLMWAGKGTKSATNYVMYIDKQGNAKFKGTVEAEFVSGEISRTSVINEWSGSTGVQAKSQPTRRTSIDAIIESEWTTVTMGVNNIGYWECPAPPFAYGHVPYCHVTFNVYGPAQSVGAFRLQWKRAASTTWTTVNKSVFSIWEYGETKSLAASVSRVYERSMFRLQIAGFDASRPFNSVRNGLVMGIR